MTGFGLILIIVIASTILYWVYDLGHKRGYGEGNNNARTELEQKVTEASQLKTRAEELEKLWRATLQERAKGYPTLIRYLSKFDKALDDFDVEYLSTKSHPAVKGAEAVQDHSARRRQAERKTRQALAIVEYYEHLAPFLLDYKNEVIDEEEIIDDKPFTEQEKEDKATNYLTVEEYRKLPSAKRNQMALDRFWKRPYKPKWLLGRLYELYIGYLYESKGYEVEYTGIIKRYEDLGRDLICTKGNELIVIQCKNWSKFKTIYENHIFQFFGTVFQYTDENPGKKVKAIFYCTTSVSDLAHRFAKELGIELKENFKFDQNYPTIKCNISRRDNTKIYHLLFDQQYDKIKVEPDKGEFYCQTVKEAEDKGFRRAFRYKGLSKR